jgi:AbrB family looped-hinge helix DNA binding protein
MNVRAKVSSKGQVVIPKKIREDLGIVDGTEIEFVAQGGAFSCSLSRISIRDTPRFRPEPS